MNYRTLIPVLLFGFIFSSLFPILAEDEKGINHFLKNYLDAYQDYLKARINEDPTAPEKLKIYNQAYDDYLEALRTSSQQGELIASGSAEHDPLGTYQELTPPYHASETMIPPPPVFPPAKAASPSEIATPTTDLPK